MQIATVYMWHSVSGVGGDDDNDDDDDDDDDDDKDDDDDSHDHDSSSPSTLQWLLIVLTNMNIQDTEMSGRRKSPVLAMNFQGSIH